MKIPMEPKDQAVLLENPITGKSKSAAHVVEYIKTLNALWFRSLARQAVFDAVLFLESLAMISMGTDSFPLWVSEKDEVKLKFVTVIMVIYVLSFMVKGTNYCFTKLLRFKLVHTTFGNILQESITHSVTLGQPWSPGGNWRILQWSSAVLGHFPTGPLPTQGVL